MRRPEPEPVSSGRGSWPPALAPALAAALLALAIWFGPATPNVAFDGLLGSPDGEIQSDINLYFGYAEQIGDGRLPYRDFFIEYPPLAAPTFALPYAFGKEVVSYRTAFFVLMGVLAALAAGASALAAGACRRDRATQLAAGGLVAIGPLLLGHELAPSRFDMLVVALVAAAMLAAGLRRDGWAGALVGLGVATKLWPGALLIPLAALALRRGGGATAKRLLAGFALAVAVPFGLALLASPSGTFDSLRFQLDRPLQVEAPVASGLLMARQAGLGDLAGEGSFESRSVNLVGEPAGVAAVLVGVIGLALAAALVVAGARRVFGAATERDAFEAAALTGLTLIVVALAFGRVLSPQFLLWLLPLPFLIGRGRWAAGALVALVVALTNAAFSGVDAYQYEYELGATALYLLRALALLTLLALLVIELRRRPGAVTSAGDG